MKPFIKIVGGKTKMLPRITELLPDAWEVYREIFVGGGALYWHLAELGRISRAALSDTNAELVNTYNVVRGNGEKLCDWLDILRETSTACGSTDEFYYTLRDRFDVGASNTVLRAARFLFLNKIGFNGLGGIRVNKAGAPNAPCGDNKTVFDRELILKCGQVLGRSDTYVSVLDFSLALKLARLGDFVFADSPYLEGFVGYTKEGWTVENLIELRDQAVAAATRGANVMLTQPDIAAVHDLFQGWRIELTTMPRAVNADGSGRGAVGELILVKGPFYDKV